MSNEIRYGDTGVEGFDLGFQLASPSRVMPTVQTVQDEVNRHRKDLEEQREMVRQAIERCETELSTLHGTAHVLTGVIDALAVIGGAEL